MTDQIETTDAPNYNFPTGWTTKHQRAATPEKAIYQTIVWFANMDISIDDYKMPFSSKLHPHEFEVEVKIGKGIVRDS